MSGHETRLDAAGCGCQRFSRAGIGEKTYRKIMATLSRSCRRLGERSLVVCLVGTNAHWSGVEITDKGRGCLSVNTVEKKP